MTVSRRDGRFVAGFVARSGSGPGSRACESRRHGGERDDRGPDQDGERDVRHDRPRPEARPDVGRPDHDLSDEERECDGREANDRGVSVGVGSRPDRRPQHEEQRDGGERSVEEHRRGGAAERGDEPAVHQGPVREDELAHRLPGRTCRPAGEDRRSSAAFRVQSREGWVRRSRGCSSRPLRRHLRHHRALATYVTSAIRTRAATKCAVTHQGRAPSPPPRRRAPPGQHQREREDRGPEQRRLPTGHAGRGEVR